MERVELDSGTALSLQRPSDGRAARALALIYDGRPMIEDGVPAALDRAVADATVPPIDVIYAESIEGAGKRGPSRHASLTTATTLDRFLTEVEGAIAGWSIRRASPHRRVVIGHSLGSIAALYTAATRDRWRRHAVTLSPALWWPGEGGQLSGDDALRLARRRRSVRVWTGAGDEEDDDIRDSTDLLVERLAGASRHVERQDHPGGHAVRPEDVVTGVARLMGDR